MLSASADLRLGQSRDYTSIVLERGFRGHIIWREQLTFDTRYTAHSPIARPCGHVFVLLEGTLTFVDGEQVAAPVAYLFDNHEIDVPDPSRARMFQIGGSIVRALHFRIPEASLRRPQGLAHGPLPLGAPTWAAADRLAPRAPTEATHDVDPARLRDVFAALGVDGVVAPELAEGIVGEEPARFVRLWDAIRHFYADFAVSTSLKRVALMLLLSPRQVTRDVAEFAEVFDMPGRGFRDATHLYRIRYATLLLSAPGVTATEIAKRLGYGTLTALGRAFRDAGLPAPSEISAALRGG